MSRQQKVGLRTVARVLHVVEKMDRGATESLLLWMLKHGRKRGVPIDWTFYCIHSTDGPLADEAARLGAKVIGSPVGIDRPFAFSQALREELRTGGYDVLHAHHDLMSGLYLLASEGLPLKRRVVHVHNAGEAIPTSNRLKIALYKPILRRLILARADRIVGISNHVLDTFLAGRKRRTDRDEVVYSGIDPSRFFDVPPDRLSFRRELAFPENARIILFPGRIVTEKNPLLAIEVFAALRRLDNCAVAVFAGAGAQEQEVVRRAESLGVSKHVRMLGWRNDVPAIMRSCEWCIIPSSEDPMEGFGLAVVEAQLAGLRLLISRGVPDDPLLPSASYRRLALSQSANEWAAAAVELMADAPPSAAAACRELAISPMDMDRAMTNMMKLYR